MTATEQINDLLDREDWASARRVIRRELRKNPDEHWLLSQLGNTYYEERKYKQALKYAEMALAQAPGCPLILWDYANALDMLGRKQEAIGVYGDLLARGVRSIARGDSGECGEGMAWARSLLADCKYRLACCYKDLGDTKKAFKYFNDYYADLNKGIDSIYEDEIPAAYVVQIGNPKERQADQPSVTVATSSRASNLPPSPVCTPPAEEFLQPAFHRQTRSTSTAPVLR
jgi:tetratricopeptide (TPR) repeat protein